MGYDLSYTVSKAPQTLKAEAIWIYGPQTSVILAISGQFILKTQIATVWSHSELSNNERV